MRQQFDFEANFSRACSSLFEHPFCAPVDLLKKLAMRCFKSDQVVAAVIAGPNHNAIALHLQDSDSFQKVAGWQGRAVGINQTNRLEATSYQIFRSEIETFTKAVASLR